MPLVTPQLWPSEYRSDKLDKKLEKALDKALAQDGAEDKSAASISGEKLSSLEEKLARFISRVLNDLLQNKESKARHLANVHIAKNMGKELQDLGILLQKDPKAAKLASTLKELMLSSPPDARALKEQINNSGIFLENKIRKATQNEPGPLAQKLLSQIKQLKSKELKSSIYLLASENLKKDESLKALDALLKDFRNNLSKAPAKPEFAKALALAKTFDSMKLFVIKDESPKTLLKAATRAVELLNKNAASLQNALSSSDLKQNARLLGAMEKMAKAIASLQLAKNNVQIAKNPAQVLGQNKGQTLQNPAQVLGQNKGQTLQNPAQTLQNPVQTFQNQAQTFQNQAQTFQNQAQTLQNPVQTFQVQNQNQNQAQTLQNPAQNLTQNQAQTLQNPAQNLTQNQAQTLQNPAQTLQNPAQAIQNQAQNLTQNQAQTLQNQAQTIQVQNQNQAQNPASSLTQNQAQTAQNPQQVLAQNEAQSQAQNQPQSSQNQSNFTSLELAQSEFKEAGKNFLRAIINLKTAINSIAKSVGPSELGKVILDKELRLLEHSLKDASLEPNVKPQDLKMQIKNDLKALLLQAGKSPVAGEAANKLLQQIEINQILSIANADIMANLALCWQDLEQNSIKFTNGGEKFFTQIKLEFKRLGEINVFLILQEQRFLDVNVHVANPEFKSRLIENAPKFKQALTKAGLICASFFIQDLLPANTEAIETKPSFGLHRRA